MWRMAASVWRRAVLYDALSLETSLAEVYDELLLDFSKQLMG